jgi:hypothetical protein
LYDETAMKGVNMEREIRPAFENYKLYVWTSMGDDVYSIY